MNNLKVWYGNLLILALVCLLFAGCKEAEHAALGGSITEPISGPVDIGKEWTEIIPPKPLKAVSSFNYIVVKAKRLEPTLGVYGSVKFPDGSRGKIEARLYDDNGNAVDMDYCVWNNLTDLTLRKKGTVIREDGERLSPIPDFPHNTRFVKVQIRSDVQLHFDSVEWQGSTSTK
jgi:hypothetical protein